MDTISKAKRSALMSKIRSKNTEPEKMLHRALKGRGLTFMRWAELPGKPDFYFPEHSLAVEMYGCFWHDCPKHGSRPKSNKGFWNKKIIANKKRDKKNARKLKAMGFVLLIFWECEVRADAARCAREIHNVMDARKSIRPESV